MTRGSTRSVERHQGRARRARLAAPASSISTCRMPERRFPYYLIATAEASSNLARYDGVRYGYRSPFDSAQGVDEGRDELHRMRADAGSRIRSRGQTANHAGHLRAERGLLRRVLPEGAAGPTLIKGDYDRAFDRSTSWRCPRARHRITIGERASDPLQMYLADVFTVSANLAGLPASAFPAGSRQVGCRSDCS